MLKYSEIILEDVQILLECERQQIYAKLRDRVRMLRLLKSGQARSLAAVAPKVGLSVAEVRYLFSNYRKQGLQEFTRWRYGGNNRYLTAAQEQDIVAVCSEVSSNFAGQADLQQYILQTFEVSYSQPGISALCSRKKIKHKVGRPRNSKASEEQQQEYKKKSRRQ